MIRFTLKQISYFVAAAERGTTLQAAEAIRVSQPAISMAIKELEETFRQKLFVRHHARGVVLTSFGRRKLAEARRLLDWAHVMSEPESGRLSGRLEIGLFSTLAPAYAPALFRAFREAHPEVLVSAREATLDQLHHDLESGTIELALVYDLDIAARINRVPLGSVTPYALLPARHPLAAKKAVSIRDLAKETFVLIDLPGSRDHFLSIFTSRGLAPRGIVRSSSLEMVRGLVASGAGVSILATRPYGDRSYDGGKLVCLPLSDKAPAQPIILASTVDVPVTHIAQAFIDASRSYFASHPDIVNPGARA